MPRIEQEYVRTGRIRYYARNLPLETIHKNAFAAARAVVCAGEQGKHREMRDRLVVSGDRLATDELTTHATAIGLDAAAFQACMEGEGSIASVRRDMADAARAGITGTPAFLIATIDTADPGKLRVLRKLTGAQPFTAFQGVLEEISKRSPR